MGFVVDGVVALGILALIIWMVFFRKSLVTDQIHEEEEAHAQEERARRDAAEALLYQPGQPLRCMGCGAAFTGPLPDSGCPQCHLSGLVVVDEAGTTSHALYDTDDLPPQQAIRKDQ